MVVDDETCCTIINVIIIVKSETDLHGQHYKRLVVWMRDMDHEAKAGQWTTNSHSSDITTTSTSVSDTISCFISHYYGYHHRQIIYHNLPIATILPNDHSTIDADQPHDNNSVRLPSICSVMLPSRPISILYLRQVSRDH